MTPRHVEVLATELRRLAGEGCGLMINTSARTGPDNTRWLKAALSGVDAIFFDVGRDASGRRNPYFGALALADYVLVTEDSANMAADAAGAGKPVYILPLAGVPPRVAQFHEQLRDHGATRPFEGKLENWTYPPFVETDRVASTITERWRQAAESPESPPPPSQKK